VSPPHGSQAAAGSRRSRPAGPPRESEPDGPPDEPAINEFAARVLDVVETIPSGRVMAYGDVAEYLSAGGPRQVGRVMSLWGGGVAWWRVVHADGSFLAGHERAALTEYRAEGTPLRMGTDGRPSRIDMRRARWPD
jgi:alkylated DNA nucleotide flippase Atl1